MEHGQEGTKPGFLQAFDELEDPRSRACAHRLDELLLVALCAITSGADSWVTVVDWGRMKLDWLRCWLPFANGIASHDTFSRVFSLLDAKGFEACFLDWMHQLCPALQGQLVSIDGKSVRGLARGRARDDTSGVGLAPWRRLGARPSPHGSQEQRNHRHPGIARCARPAGHHGHDRRRGLPARHRREDRPEQGRLPYRGQQQPAPTLAQAVESLFEDVEGGVRDGRLSQDTTLDKGHGRIETRQCVLAHDVSALAEPGQHWPGLRSAVMIKSIRETFGGKSKGERTVEWR
jgi:hypothetical protein